MAQQTVAELEKVAKAANDAWISAIRRGVTPDVDRALLAAYRAARKAYARAAAGLR